MNTLFYQPYLISVYLTGLQHFGVPSPLLLGVGWTRACRCVKEYKEGMNYKDELFLNPTPQH